MGQDQTRSPNPSRGAREIWRTCAHWPKHGLHPQPGTHSHDIHCANRISQGERFLTGLALLPYCHSLTCRIPVRFLSNASGLHSKGGCIGSHLQYHKRRGPQEVHRKLKTPIAPLFTLANIPSLEPRVNEVLDCIHEKLEEKIVGNDQVFNLGDWLQFFAFDVTATLTFSKRYGFLDAGKDVEGMLASIVFSMLTSAPVCCPDHEC